MALVPHLKAEDARPLLDRLRAAAGLDRAALAGLDAGGDGDGRHLVGNHQTRAWLARFGFI